MSRYGSIFAKKGERKTYEREIVAPYNIDKDSEVQKEIARLEELATFVRRSSSNCEMTEVFLENMFAIGCIHEKYAKLISLHKGSISHRRFHNAIKDTRDARRVFVQDCECKYRKKFY